MVVVVGGIAVVVEEDGLTGGDPVDRPMRDGMAQARQ